MHLATIKDGIVVDIIDVGDETVIAVGGESASIPGTYSVETAGQDPVIHEYTSEINAPEGAFFVEASTDIGLGWRYNIGEFLPPVAPTLTKEELIEYTALARFRYETGGISIQGSTILTDRESQSKIAGAFALAQNDPEESIDFKAATGWITIDSATMIAIGLAVARHVRECFTTERNISDQVEAGTITTTAQIDAAFPLN